MIIQPLETLLVAALVLLVGRLVNRRIRFLSHYNIPDPITGGLLFAVALSIAKAFGDLNIDFVASLRPILLLTFFAAVGLSADLALLKQGGRRLLMFVIVLIPFLFMQNIVGVLLAMGLDLHPLMGLVGGSITLVGGHGTGAAYAERFAEVNNLQSVMELSMTAATLGLILGGIAGGPLGEWLINRHRLAGAAASGTTPPDAQTIPKAAPQATPPLTSAGFIPVLAATLVAVIGGQLIADAVSDSPITLPSFLWCLLLGLFIRNAGQLIGFRLCDQSVELISSLNLSLFLAMTMMALNLASVVTLAGPLLLILAGQLAVVLLFGAWLTFRAVGRDYESAVMSAAFCGFALGATATAIANMQAITQKYGPAPQSFVVVPLVGAFLIDLLNALVLTGFLSLKWMGA